MDVCGPFASAPRSVGLGAALALALAVGLGTPGPGQAQIVRDGTVGPAGSLAGPNYTIPHTDGTRVGGNLFHSFGRFNIRTGESATFTGPNEISHVISRVTGGERSTIDGLLRSQVGKATFWFLNPAGVLFGPNARLDVPAAFHVSTADEVRFADGARFSASDPAASRLTVAPPEAFGFLRPNPAGIAVNSSQLETQARQTLSVVGGDLQVSGGTLVSAGGQVNIVAMAGPGTVQATTGASTAPAHGAVRLAQNAQVDTSGNGGGQITIYGGQIEVAGSSVLTENTGAQDAKGGITVAGDAVRVADGGKISSSTRARGSAGRVAVTGRELNVRNGGLINSNTFTQGDAGTVSVTTGDLAVSNGGVISSATFAQGNAGRVTIHADRLLVSGDGAQPFTGLSSSTSGQGRAGTVTVQADRLLVSGDDAQPFTGLSSEATDGSAGPAGAVTVTGHAIAVRNGGGGSARQATVPRVLATSPSPPTAAYRWQATPGSPLRRRKPMPDGSSPVRRIA